MARMAPPRGRRIGGQAKASGTLARIPRPGRHWAWVATLVVAFFVGVPLVHALMGEIAALGLLVFLAGVAVGRLSVRI